MKKPKQCDCGHRWEIIGEGHDENGKRYWLQKCKLCEISRYKEKPSNTKTEA